MPRLAELRLRPKTKKHKSGTWAASTPKSQIRTSALSNAKDGSGSLLLGFRGLGRAWAEGFEIEVPRGPLRPLSTDSLSLAKLETETLNPKPPNKPPRPLTRRTRRGQIRCRQVLSGNAA